jgi:hypothetical protein
MQVVPAAHGLDRQAVHWSECIGNYRRHTAWCGKGSAVPPHLVSPTALALLMQDPGV